MTCIDDGGMALVNLQEHGVEDLETSFFMYVATMYLIMFS